LLWEPLQIGGNNSFFFFTIPFWRWIFIQKKIVKRQFFSSLFSRFPVYVCVCDETTENPFPACAFIIQCASLICQQKCVGIGRGNPHTYNRKREELEKELKFFFFQTFISLMCLLYT
jgi:hypothetical protein